MSKFTKVVLGGAVSLLALLPTFAFASTNNVLFDDGNGSNQITAGETITMHAFVNTNSNQALESVFIKWPGATGIAQQGKCYTLTPPQQGDSPITGWDIPVSVDVTPTHAGSWGPDVTFYGIAGDAEDTQCAGAPVFGTQFFPNRLIVTNSISQATVIPNSTGITSNGTTVTSNNDIASVLLQILQQFKMVSSSSPAAPTPPAPTGNQAKCATVQPYLGAQPYAYSQTGVQLQSALLLDNPGAIPALHAGSLIPMGFFGKQTHQALTNFSAMYGCGFIFN